MSVAIAKDARTSLWTDFITTQEAAVGFALYYYKEDVTGILGPSGANLTSVDEVTQADLDAHGTVVGGTGGDDVIFDHASKYADITLEEFSVSTTASGARNNTAVTVTTEVSVAPDTEIKSYAIVYGNLDVSNAACKVLTVADFTSTITITSANGSTNYTVPAESIVLTAD